MEEDSAGIRSYPVVNSEKTACGAKLGEAYEHWLKNTECKCAMCDKEDCGVCPSCKHNKTRHGEEDKKPRACIQKICIKYSEEDKKCFLSPPTMNHEESLFHIFRFRVRPFKAHDCHCITCNYFQQLGVCFEVMTYPHDYMGLGRKGLQWTSCISAALPSIARDYTEASKQELLEQFLIQLVGPNIGRSIEKGPNMAGLVTVPPFAAVTPNRAAVEESSNEQIPVNHNVWLVGTDDSTGEGIPANKSFLAAKSPVFQRMFCGPFRERDQDKVPLGYPSVVLKVLVQYSNSGEIDLDLIYTNDDITIFSDEDAVSFVQLRDAANYYELYDIHETVSEHLGEEILKEEKVGCVCAVLAELYTQGATVEDPLWNIMISVLQEPQMSETCLLPPESVPNEGLAACSLAVCHRILTASVEPSAATKAIRKWKEVNSVTTQEDTLLLQEIEKTISLRSLSLQDLLGQVQPSSPGSRCKIYIQGAGVEGVNGYYYAANEMENDDFEKDGVFDGEPCTYKLTTHKINGDFGDWEIQVHTNYHCESTVGRHIAKEPEPRRLRRRIACMSVSASPPDPSYLLSYGSYLLLYEVSEAYASGRRFREPWNIPFALWDSAGESATSTPYVAILPLDHVNNAET